MNRSTPGIPVHHQLPEFTQTHVHWVSDTIQPSHPLLSPSPPAPNPSQHQSQLFAWGGQSTGVSALASFLPKKSQGQSPSEWLDLLAVQGTLKSLLQHHSSKASILRRSAFFTVQLSHPELIVYWNTRHKRIHVLLKVTYYLKLIGHTANTLLGSIFL